MHRIWVATLVALLIAGFTLAQEKPPAEYYQDYTARQNEIRKEHPDLKEFIAAFKPVREAMWAYVAEADPEGMSEENLLYLALLASMSTHQDKSVEFCQQFLDRFPRSPFATLVREKLFYSLTRVDKVEEAEELLKRLQGSYLRTYFYGYQNISWVYNRLGDKENYLRISQHLFDEMIRRSGHEPLPDYELSHVVSGYTRLMSELGKEKELLELYKESLKKLEPDSFPYRRLSVEVNALELIGSPAPEMTLERWINGEGTSIESLRGKVVLLDFWATWCGPCIAAFPDLKDIQLQYADKDFALLGLTKYYGRYKLDQELTKDQEAAKITDIFVPEHKLTWPLGIADDERLFTNYGISGLPTAILIDRQGVVRYRLVGHPEGFKEELTNKIDELVKEGGPGAGS